MKKRFIIATAEATPEQNKAFLQKINEAGAGWWHWINNFWLIADWKGQFSVAELRDLIKELYPGADMIVIELNEYDDTWASYGPERAGRSMSKWLRETWSKAKDQ
jgi:hypothetical protein